MKQSIMYLCVWAIVWSLFIFNEHSAYRGIYILFVGGFVGFLIVKLENARQELDEAYEILD